MTTRNHVVFSWQTHGMVNMHICNGYMLPDMQRTSSTSHVRPLSNHVVPLSNHVTPLTLPGHVVGGVLVTTIETWLGFLFDKETGHSDYWIRPDRALGGKRVIKSFKILENDRWYNVETREMIRFVSMTRNNAVHGGWTIPISYACLWKYIVWYMFIIHLPVVMISSCLM